MVNEIHTYYIFTKSILFTISEIKLINALESCQGLHGKVRNVKLAPYDDIMLFLLPKCFEVTLIACKKS